MAARNILLAATCSVHEMGGGEQCDGGFVPLFCDGRGSCTIFRRGEQCDGGFVPLFCDGRGLSIRCGNTCIGYYKTVMMMMLIPHEYPYCQVTVAVILTNIRMDTEKVSLAHIVGLLITR